MNLNDFSRMALDVQTIMYYTERIAVRRNLDRVSGLGAYMSLVEFAIRDEAQLILDND